MQLYVHLVIGAVQIRRQRRQRRRWWWWWWCKFTM